MPARRQAIGWLPSLLLTAFLSACFHLRTPAPAEGALATRLVLALDGIDYRDVMAARELGMFKQFRQPSRLISTFPSISDIAWHEIFGVLPPRGYQRIYYSTAYNTMVGTTLDAIRPIEFEDRMDMAFGSKFHHLGAYLYSNKVASGEVDDAVRDFFAIRGRATVYVYNVGPDALQHTRGDLAGYLRHLDERLDSLQAEYSRRTGRSLQIVILSDHGHNHTNDAKLLPVAKALEAGGFRVAERLRSPMDVVFSVDGVTTGFGVFAQPDSIVALTRLLSGTEGVELVSRRINDSVFVVRDSIQEARIDMRRGPAGDRYRYLPLSGDPLQYDATLERMRAEKVLDADGFADADAWLRYTVASEYPAAVVRIARGHTQVTLNTAPILVSLNDHYRVGLGMVSLANRVRPLGGTHGALGATNSLGVLMTNFQDTQDDLTTSVRRQLGGFADLGAVPIKSAGARLTSGWMISRDERSPFFSQKMLQTGPRVPALAEGLEVWITNQQLAWAADSGTLRVEVHRMHDKTTGDTLLSASETLLPTANDGATLISADGPPHYLFDGWMMGADRWHYLLPLTFAPFLARNPPNATYQVRVSLHRPRRGSGSRTESTNLVTLVIRPNDRGEFWPY